MSNERKFIIDKISTKVDMYVQDKQPLEAAVIARDICDDHSHKIDDDDEFHRITSFGYVKENVIRFLTKHFDNPNKQADTNQRSFDGWEYLQTHYFVEREGKRVCEHITEISGDELRQIASRIRSKAKGLQKHADEIDAYLAKVETLFTV